MLKILPCVDSGALAADRRRELTLPHRVAAEFGWLAVEAGERGWYEDDEGARIDLRARPRPDSSAWAILSPDVPVFRRDDGTALPAPWPLSPLTCAAPYAPTIGQPESGDLLQGRIVRVLAIARAYGYEALVLGAWGCGVFANDPARTARDFRDALAGPFDGAFAEGVFAVTDWSPQRRFLGPFRDAFGAGQR